MNIRTRILILISILVVALAALLWNWYAPGEEPEVASLDYSEFIAAVQQGQVKQVTLTRAGDRLQGVRHDDGEFVTLLPSDPGLMERLLAHKVRVSVGPNTHATGADSFSTGFIGPLLAVLVIVGLVVFVLRKQLGGSTVDFKKFSHRRRMAGHPGTTLADVAGIEEAKAEVAELVDFLRDPARFQRLGGRIPRGVLMVGPPGTGKTLLARAIAGEARVPFFSLSGSDFVELYVGVGAARVRNLFAEARKNPPCIIFIDEIDAVGGKRSSHGEPGAHNEREQTLNQLLVEMDGFSGTEGIIVIGATNRPDMLDPALLRPGRFDRQVPIGLPDLKGREQILEVHMRRLPLAEDVDAAVIARGTPGLSGADLANLVNEAALLAARSHRTEVCMRDFEQARDKVLMGAERRTLVMSEKDKRITAYHEAGHTIVGLLMPDHDPVYKVSIIPRGRALGVTMFLPEQDRYNYSKRQLESMLATLFGGRVAEELVFGPDQVTTGAANDFQRATEVARDMVTKWGLSERVGPLVYHEDSGNVYLGGAGRLRNVGPATAQLIDTEVRAVVERAYRRARTILREQEARLHAMAHALIEHETIDADQIAALMAGSQPPVELGVDGKGSGLTRLLRQGSRLLAEFAVRRAPLWSDRSAGGDVERGQAGRPAP